MPWFLTPCERTHYRHIPSPCEESCNQTFHHYIKTIPTHDSEREQLQTPKLTERGFTRHKASKLLAKEVLIESKLLGGIMKSAGETNTLIKGAVDLLVKGNREELRKHLSQASVKARVQLPNGEWIEGQYQGLRTVSKGTRNNFCMMRYTMIACGRGEFHSESVEYKGDFYNNLFHDHTGMAVYYIAQDTRYTGSFSYGKRSDIGKLEKYNKSTHEFYTYFRGTWREDQPYDGNYYAPNGEVISQLQKGVPHPHIPSTA